MIRTLRAWTPPSALLIGVLAPLCEAEAAPDANLPQALTEQQIVDVTEGWRNRVFLVVADGGPPARVQVDRVLENPRSLFRKRRVGCAVYLGERRYLLTTASIVGRTDEEVEVFNEQGHNILARVVGVDRFLDLALLRSHDLLPGTESVPPLEEGREAPAGEACLVLGNAYGRSLSATLGSTGGVISVLASGMPIRLHRLVADIYPGDSGAPVLDHEGRFVGIVTAVSRTLRPPVLEDTGGELGFETTSDPAGMIGFAVPAHECRRAWMDLRDFGTLRRAYLGVDYLPDPNPEAMGARILRVHPNSPAERAGLLPGDLVTTFGSRFVADGRQFCALVASSTPGERVQVRLVRNQREMQASIELLAAKQRPGLRWKPVIRSNPLPAPTTSTPVTAENADH